MRASWSLQAYLGEGAAFLHAKQWTALWRAVEGLLNGGQLWLTALGRSLAGDATIKHRIKAADRLLGNSSIQRARIPLYATLARFLMRRIKRPVILIDWTGGGSSAFYILSAALCFQGRALTIYSRTFPAKKKCSPKAEREFLSELVSIVPKHCAPIIVTDAGFLFKWIDAVRAVGWDYIARLRGSARVQIDGQFLSPDEVHALAGNRHKNLGVCAVRKQRSCHHRLVLSKRRKLKGRHRITFNGTKGRNTADRQRGDAARQPLLLATSLQDSSTAVVKMYALRMQIEETFRDVKSHRYGWSLEDVRSRTEARVDVLLLIAAFASVAVHMVGIAARAAGLDRQLQANTERRRPVFSSFFLGNLALRFARRFRLTAARSAEARRELLRMLAEASSI